MSSVWVLTELEGGEQGVDAGERDVALAGEAPEGVEAALGVAQRVEDDAVDAVVALAAVGVGRGDAVAVEEEELHELAAVVLGGELGVCQNESASPLTSRRSLTAL